MRIGTPGIAGSVNLAGGQSGSGHREAENRAPVIPPAVGVEVRRPAKLAGGNDECFFQQTSRVQILDQSGEADVKLRTENIADARVVLRVGCPTSGPRS